MVQKTFSPAWKSSSQPRKQRKYRYNAPLHIKQKLVHVHLSSALRQKYGTRHVQVRKNDKVRVLRGQYKMREGKVERVDLKRERIYITGMEVIKKDGSKVMVPLNPSNLMVLDLDLGDKKRKEKLESHKKVSAGSAKVEQPTKTKRLTQ